MERESNYSKQSIKEIASLSLGAVMIVISAVFVFSILGAAYLRLITNPEIYPSFLRK
jgi:uncharacterized protein (UPF0254 family)